MWSRVLALVLVFSFGSRAQSEKELAPRVSGAVARGVEWLKKHQKKDGTFARRDDAHRFGKSALAALALVHSGVRRTDPHLRKTLAYLRKNYESLLKPDGFAEGATYSLSLFVMTLDALYVGTATEAKRPPPWARKAVDRTMKWMLGQRRQGQLFGYPAAPLKGPQAAMIGYDLSNTQYALLALWSASRCGCKIRPEQLEEIGRLLLAAQERDGPKVRRKIDSTDRTHEAPLDKARGFEYMPAGQLRLGSSGSMTAGGLSSLLLVKAMLMKQDRLTSEFRSKLDRGIWDAFAWLCENYTVRKNPMAGGVGLPGPWHRYYLHGLERACVIARRQRLGVHDWYREGANALLESQRGDGAWAPKTPFVQADPDLGGKVVDTCFALLFLRRASPRPRLPVLPARPVTPRSR